MLLSLLVFIFSIPGTMAARNIIATILLAILGTYFFKKRSVFFSDFLRERESLIIIIILAILTIYILIHSIFISHDAQWSLAEFKSHWLYPVLYFVMGIFLVFFYTYNKPSLGINIINIVFYSLSVHVLIVDLYAINYYIQNDALPIKYSGLTKSPALISYITNIILSLSISEFIYRFRTSKKNLIGSNKILFFILILCLLSVNIVNMRNQLISILFIGFIASFFVLYGNNKYKRKSKVFIAMMLMFVLSLPLTYSLKYDSRWDTFSETVLIALDTNSNKFWINHDYGLPKLSNGTPVNDSNYERIAFLKKGIEYIGNNYLGIGYGRNAFGHAIQMYENDSTARGKHSHSSFIDLTVGAGVLSIILWLLFIIKLFLYSFQKYKINVSYYSIAISILTVDFVSRSLIDSIMRDHMFQQYMLILGILLAMLMYKQNNESKSV